MTPVNPVTALHSCHFLRRLVKKWLLRVVTSNHLPIEALRRQKILAERLADSSLKRSELLVYRKTIMTLRTYRDFVCPQGHKGEEKTSENDQPYSKHWESVEVAGMRESGKDAKGHTTFACEQCGEAMSFVRIR